MGQGTEGTEKDKVTSNFNPNTPSTTKPLFSDVDVRRIVRNFIEAFLRGAVKVTISKEQVKKTIPNREDFAHQTEGQLFDLIESASGVRETEPESIETSIKFLYGWIVVLRQKGMMEGTFLQSTELEAKIEQLEDIVGKLASAIENVEKYGPELESLKELKPVLLQAKRIFDRWEKDMDKGENEGVGKWR